MNKTTDDRIKELESEVSTLKEALDTSIYKIGEMLHLGAFEEGHAKSFSKNLQSIIEQRRR